VGEGAQDQGCGLDAVGSVGGYRCCRQRLRLFVSTKTVLDPTSPFVGIFDWPGGNWNDAAFAAAVLAGVTWLALTIPVLIAGLRRILGWPGKRLMAAAWAGAWVAGVALMALIPASVASSKTLEPPSRTGRSW
jgi:hypothetical protein